MHKIIHTEWGSLPAVRLQHASGASALVTLYGAHLLEWTSADGVQHLFCSERSSRDGSKAIRGGVPVIFPQFAAQGSGMRHGFARVSHWRLLTDVPPASNPHHVAPGMDAPCQMETDTPCQAEFALTPVDVAPELRQAWPHEFALRWRITLEAHSITLQLRVDNHGDCAFDFASALHSYWQVDQLSTCSIHGLQHLNFGDQTTAPPGSGRQEEETLQISSKIDRIYQQATAPIRLHHGAQHLQMQQHGFCDAVVWNPGAQDAAALADMADDEYQKFVCIEAAQIERVTLAPGASWEGWQRIETTLGHPG